jgi:pimeloyl-ACP methyl ester carboxylesterase
MEELLRVGGAPVMGALESPGRERLAVLLHGFTGNLQGPNGMFDALSARLQSGGFSVLRFNFRGTNPSGMAFEDMTIETETADFRAVVRLARGMGYRRIAALGESMGATVAVCGYSRAVRALVLWYPDFDFSDDRGFRKLLAARYRKELERKGSVEVGPGFRIGKGFYRQLDRIELYERMGKVACPVLMLHGDRDREVPATQSKKAYRLLRGPKRLVLLKGVGHCFRSRRKEEDSSIMSLNAQQRRAIDVSARFLEERL